MLKAFILLFIFSLLLSYSFQVLTDAQVKDKLNNLVGNARNNNPPTASEKSTSRPVNPNYSDELNFISTATREELLLNKNGTKVSNNCYIPANRKLCAPQYVIAGSMKCGTTSLHTYLLNHPQVVPLPNDAKIQGKPILANKEIRFFNDGQFTRLLQAYPLTDVEDMYYNLFKNIEPQEGEDQIFTGDATPMYVSADGASKRCFHTLPEAKVIIMVRNPIDRLYSEYWFKQDLSTAGKKFGQELFPDCIRPEIKRAKACNIDKFLTNPTVEGAAEFKSCLVSVSKNATKDKCSSPEFEGMCASAESYAHCTGGALKNSLYIVEILEWLDMYQDNLMIVKSEDFYQNTDEVMEDIAEFIGLTAPMEWHTVTTKAFNIINPMTPSGKEHELISTNKNGLFVGGSEASAVSDYPELNPAIREEFHEFFTPANEALGRVLGRNNFWP